MSKNQTEARLATPPGRVAPPQPAEPAPPRPEPVEGRVESAAPADTIVLIGGPRDGQRVPRPRGACHAEQRQGEAGTITELWNCGTIGLTGEIWLHTSMTLGDAINRLVAVYGRLA